MKERTAIVTGVVCVVAFVLVVVWTNLNVQSPEAKDPFPREADEPTDAPAHIYVEVKGAVRLPGVYKVEKGTRLYEVVARAGGLEEDADTADINLAAMVSDGSAYSFPKRTADESDGPEEPKEENGLVSINTASKDELMSLPNIGPATAENIIAHREAEGPFERLEDLMDVRGIGEATFDDLEGLITL